jgi:hypothetical protein
VRVGLALLGVVAAIAAAAVAAAAQPSAGTQRTAPRTVDVQDNWLPHPDDATWTYQWSNNVYSADPTTEDVSVQDSKGKSFTLAWQSEDTQPSDAATTSGQMSFQQTNVGLFNTGWSSSAPPPEFPILCAQARNCNNTIAATYHMLIWGSRSPTLQEPLVDGMEWDSTGGASGDVSSSSSYVGTQKITVPAFDHPVVAAKVRSEITQAGALGDPFGSGVRYVWWVYGVGPVKIEFDHASRETTTAVLQSTNQTPQDPPPDANYFPLTKGLTNTYSWSNPRYLKKPSVQKFTVDAVLNQSASVSVKSVSGPINVAGAYGFTLRLDGVTSLWGRTKAASLAKFPPLGPSALPTAKRRHFFTPFDLMTFGFSPILSAYPAGGQSWNETAVGRDYSIYGVTGSSKVLGVQKVKVPGGTFKALAVRTQLTQPGFKFGTGTRTSWFAPKVGLVKLVFQHADGSTSTVVLLKTTGGK